MTPNTAAIMGDVPNNRRGIGNGIRSMMQNSGFLVGSAPLLAVVTSRLGGTGRRAVYGGMLPDLAGGKAAICLDSFRTAFLMLFLLCLAGSVLCGWRGLKRRPGHGGRT